MEPNQFKGRGAQKNTINRFLKTHTETDPEYLELLLKNNELEEYTHPKTKFIDVFPKTIINKVDSPDVGSGYSMNPYQGCEHGCIYCYARNSHEYWGYNSGLDFERVILVKRNAAKLLEKELRAKNWKPCPIMLSGNTDCYQPIERKLQITREMLKVLLLFKHPVGIITKNALVLRDLDLLKSLAELNLVIVSLSITTNSESIRAKLEPRTSSITNRIKAVEVLSKNGIPVNVMIAPIIPGLNDDSIVDLISQVSAAGAKSVNYTMVRLNGQIGDVFTDWIEKTFPEKAKRVLHLIREVQNGQLNNSEFGTRMRGTGEYAKHIKQLFEMGRLKYLKNRTLPKLNTSLFEVPKQAGDQLKFDL